MKKNKNNFYNLRCTLDDIKDYFVIKTVFQNSKKLN